MSYIAYRIILDDAKHNTQWYLHRKANGMFAWNVIAYGCIEFDVHHKAIAAMETALTEMNSRVSALDVYLQRGYATERAVAWERYPGGALTNMMEELEEL